MGGEEDVKRWVNLWGIGEARCVETVAAAKAMRAFAPRLVGHPCAREGRGVDGTRTRNVRFRCTAEREEYAVVNFYHLVDLEDVSQEAELHRRFCEKRDLRGRIYLSPQGINAQFGGKKEDALDYADFVESRPSFRGLRYSVEDCEGHAFPRLAIREKEWLIPLQGGTMDLPVTDPSRRATPLSPSEWKRMIQHQERDGRKPVLLDVRNGYEWDAGHFRGASRPFVDVFRETPTTEGIEEAFPELKEAEEGQPILMYCTGGIRCDIYSTMLKQQGFDHLYTLEGGIANYLRDQGDDEEVWNGSLYVFDQRLATYRDKPAATGCQHCGGPVVPATHINCANADCNWHFLCCRECREKFHSCCSTECMQADRLRPALERGGRYERLHEYADDSSEDRWQRGEGTRRRRRQWRARLRLRRAQKVADQLHGLGLSPSGESFPSKVGDQETSAYSTGTRHG